MRSSRPLIGFLVAGALFRPYVVAAECLVCDEVVEFDNKRADCFRQDYQTFLDKADRSTTNNAEIDLSACVGSDGMERRGLDKFPDLLEGERATAGSQSGELRSVYILDRNAIVCLKRLVDEHQGAIDPKVEFDLIAQCRS